MRSETINRGNLTLRKEAVVGINYTDDPMGLGQSMITLYLIGGQTINITVESKDGEAAFQRWKNLASL